MFISSKKFKLEKGYYTLMSENFLKTGLIDKQDGFIKVELLLNDKKKDFDILVVNTHWESHEAFMNWERSPEHIAGHKARVNQPKPIEILESTFETYVVYGEKLK